MIYCMCGHMFDDCFSDAGTIGPVEDARKGAPLEGVLAV